MFNLQNIELYPYQKNGIEYALEHKHVIIGDEMGLGKTVQALGVAAHTGKFTLIVCPAYLKQNWKNEINKFCPQLKYKII